MLALSGLSFLKIFAHCRQNHGLMQTFDNFSN